MVAVGLADGRILLHNIRYDETIVQFKQDWGPVTALTFRTGQSGSQFLCYPSFTQSTKCMTFRLHDTAQKMDTTVAKECIHTAD